MKALDRYTVRFTLKHPYSEFPDTLGGQAFWVWPDDYRQKVGPRGVRRGIRWAPGPYRFLQEGAGASPSTW